MGPAGRVKVTIQGRVRGGVEGMEMFNAAAEGAYGTKVGVTRHAVSKGFTTGAVLLISVGEGCVGPLLHFMQRAVTGRDVLDKGTAEGCVSEAEGLTAASVSSRGEGNLAQTAEEEESEGGQVEDGLGSGLVMVLGKAGGKGTKDGDVDWPHPGGGGVLVSPGLEKGLEVEDVMDAVQPGIQVAQSGELLAHSR